MEELGISARQRIAERTNIQFESDPLLLLCAPSELFTEQWEGQTGHQKVVLVLVSKALAGLACLRFSFGSQQCHLVG